MSGKPQYDEAAVIDAAVKVFWRHGYAAASISDLTEATGLSRSSLYQRFGDKDGLFRNALERYTEFLLQRMQSVTTGVSARDRLESLLRGFVPKGSTSKRPPGCLIARSCAELVDLPSAEGELALAGLARQREHIARLLREGMEGGELPRNTDIDALAWYYLGVMKAVVELPQAGASTDTLGRMIDIAMGSWPKRPR